MGATAPFWRFSVASYPDLQVKMPSKSTVTTAKTTNGDSEESSQVINIVLIVHIIPVACIHFFFSIATTQSPFILTWFNVLFDFCIYSAKINMCIIILPLPVFTIKAVLF